MSELNNPPIGLAEFYEIGYRDAVGAFTPPRPQYSPRFKCDPVEGGVLAVLLGNVIETWIDRPASCIPRNGLYELNLVFDSMHGSSDQDGWSLLLAREAQGEPAVNSWGFAREDEYECTLNVDGAVLRFEIEQATEGAGTGYMVLPPHSSHIELLSCRISRDDLTTIIGGDHASMKLETDNGVELARLVPDNLENLRHFVSDVDQRRAQE